MRNICAVGLLAMIFNTPTIAFSKEPVVQCMNEVETNCVYMNAGDPITYSSRKGKQINFKFVEEADGYVIYENKKYGTIGIDLNEDGSTKDAWKVFD